LLSHKEVVDRCGVLCMVMGSMARTKNDDRVLARK
jgi:hypothetical protein